MSVAALPSHETSILDKFRILHYSAGMNQELLNCLSEALPYAIVKRGQVVPTGSGGITVTVHCPVFCKSTDAFAGTMVTAIHRVSSEEELDQWMQEVHESDPDLSFTVDGLAAEEPVQQDFEDCPF